MVQSFTLKKKKRRSNRRSFAHDPPTRLSKGIRNKRVIERGKKEGARVGVVRKGLGACELDFFFIGYY